MARLDMKAWLSRVAGSTATVPIPDEESGCTIWVKLEYLLPSGSTKDRVAAFVLGHAIERGDVTEDTIVVEASSGSTSIALAMASALLGVRFVAVMPEGVSAERVWIIRRYGGEVVLTPKEKGILGAIEKTKAMAAEDPNVFLPRQFENPLNALAHQRITGPELITQVGRSIHGFVAGVGTGGTLTGVGRVLRERKEGLRLVAVEPRASAVLSGGKPGLHGIQGLGAGFVPEVLDESLIDDIVTVTDLAADRMMRRLAREEGLLLGPSAGANVHAAREVARRMEPGQRVVTILCDTGERYFS